MTSIVVGCCVAVVLVGFMARTISKLLAVAFVVCGLCLSLSAQTFPGVIDTNANTVTFGVPGSQTYSTATPVGQFWLGFGLMFAVWIAGRILRLPRNIAGHSGGGE